MRRGARCAILSSHRRVRACGQPQSGRDANLTPRLAQRSDRGPAEKPSCRCAPPAPGVAFVTLRRIGRCRWDRGERSTTRKRGLRRDLRSQTGAARRVSAPSPEKSVVMGALSPWRTPSRGAGACGIPGRTSTAAGVLACRRPWGRPSGGDGANHCGCSCLSVWSGLPGRRQALKPKWIGGRPRPRTTADGCGRQVTTF